MDQTDLGDRFAVRMLSVRCGDRSLPPGWRIETGEANIGFAGQQVLLERVRAWLPEGAAVRVRADRFYPSAAWFEGLIAAGWQYRLRLKGNLLVDIGGAGIHPTGDLAAGVRERYEAKAPLFDVSIPTAMGVLHESGHPEPWIIAMDCPPNRAAVLDDGARWAIEPRVSDFKSRGFRWEETKIEAPKRLDCLILIMALAMDGCVQARQDDARCHPTATEKKAREQSDPNHWSVRKAYRSALSWFKRGLRLLLRRAASALPLPKFFLGMET